MNESIDVPPKAGLQLNHCVAFFYFHICVSVLGFHLLPLLPLSHQFLPSTIAVGYRKCMYWLTLWILRKETKSLTFSKFGEYHEHKRRLRWNSKTWGVSNMKLFATPIPVEPQSKHSRLVFPLCIQITLLAFSYPQIQFPFTFSSLCLSAPLLSYAINYFLALYHYLVHYVIDLK